MREQNPEYQIGDYRRLSQHGPADEEAALDAQVRAEAYFHTDG